jgi:hypothetical protein
MVFLGRRNTCGGISVSEETLFLRSNSREVDCVSHKRSVDNFHARIWTVGVVRRDISNTTGVSNS